MTVRPPTGTPPPAVAELGDDRLDLAELAREVCDRYHSEFTDERERYGEAGVDWCRHDNQWLLSWAAGDVLGFADLDEQASWLARVLHARDFPVDRLTGDLRIAAEVVEERIPGEHGTALGAALRRAAATVASLDLAPS